MAMIKIAKVEPVEMKLEVVMLSVSDSDRAKAFYEKQKLGWRLDADCVTGDFRVVQLTPHNSAASTIFGEGITLPERVQLAGES